MFLRRYQLSSLKLWLGNITLLGLVVLLAFQFGGLNKFGTGDPTTYLATSEATMAFKGSIADWVLFKVVITLCLLITLWFSNVKQEYKWIITVWSITMAVATLWQRRFDYYLAIPLSILVGFAVRSFWDYRCEVGRLATYYLNAGILLLITILCVPLSVSMVGKLPYTPSDDWHEALMWVKKNTPENALIISWWDYGYWIDYIAERPTYVDPSQDPGAIKKVAKYFISTGVPEVPANGSYVIIDGQMVNDKIEAIALWAGQEYDGHDYGKYLVTRLYYNADVVGYKLVHGSLASNVLVFEVCSR